MSKKRPPAPKPPTSAAAAPEEPKGPEEQKAPNERNLILKLVLALVLVGMAVSRLVTAFTPDPAQAAYNDGVKAFEQKDYRKAREAFTTTTQKDGEIVAAWMNLALAELELGNLPQAEEAAKKAVDLLEGGKAKGVPSGPARDTMKAQAYAHLSLAQSRQDRHTDALASIRKALEADPRNQKAATWKTVETELQARSKGMEPGSTSSQP